LTSCQLQNSIEPEEFLRSLKVRASRYSKSPTSPNMTMTQDVVTRFESHTALAEIDPNPESEADVVKIQPVFFILIEIIGR
jgi:hypothetical protein